MIRVRFDGMKFYLGNDNLNHGGDFTAKKNQTFNFQQIDDNVALTCILVTFEFPILLKLIATVMDGDNTLEQLKNDTLPVMIKTLVRLIKSREISQVVNWKNQSEQLI